MSGIISRISGFICLLLFFSLGCYENEDGCQDITASNFDALADFPCEDCCTYPNVSLVVRHRVDTLNWNSSFKIYNGVGDTFKIISAALLVNNVELQQAAGVLKVTDTETFYFDNNGTLETQTLTDDFVGIRTGSNNFTVGSHQGQNDVSAISFDLGLPASLSQITPFELPASHPLDSSGGYWSETTGYYGGYLDILYDTMTMDTVRYRLPVELMPGFQADTTFTIEYGANIELDLIIDYLSWTAGINFVEIGGNEAEVVQAIVNNLPNAISLAD